MYPSVRAVVQALSGALHGLCTGTHADTRKQNNSCDLVHVSTYDPIDLRGQRHNREETEARERLAEEVEGVERLDDSGHV